MIKLKRLGKIFTVPFLRLYAALSPVAYARRIGVRMNGKVTIYGSSYMMFSAEPYLVTLEDNVFISVGATFICHDGGVLPFRREYPDLDLAAPIHIGSDTFIGAGATILKGVTIGSRSVVAAGAMVTKSFPPGSIIGGNPARLITTSDDYLERAIQNSLKIGHLYGEEKHRRYKEIFNVKD